MGVRHCEKSELAAAGVIGLIKAVDSFELSKNTLFKTYAAKCIENEILMVLRKHKKHISYEQLYFEKVNERLAGNDHNPVISLERKEFIDVVHQLVNELPERERIAITLYYGLEGHDKLTQQDIGDRLNITQRHTSKIIKRGLKKLKEPLESYMYDDTKKYV